MPGIAQPPTQLLEMLKLTFAKQNALPVSTGRRIDELPTTNHESRHYHD